MSNLWVSVCFIATILSSSISELIQNGGFENQLAGWGTCWNFHCDVIQADEARFGSYSAEATNRTQTYQGPSQVINPIPGKFYRASSWVKILNDKPDTNGQSVLLELSYGYADAENSYYTIAIRSHLTVSDGWVFIHGDFQVPIDNFTSTTFYYQGPDIEVNYAVDNASIVEITANEYYKNGTNEQGLKQLIRNGDFEEQLADWGVCWNFECEDIPADDARFGTYSAKASHRTQTYQGLSQRIHPAPGKYYNASGWVKILNDKPGSLGQNVLLELSYDYPDGHHSYYTVAFKPLVATSDGWAFLQGYFQAPNDNFSSASLFYQGPEVEVDYAVDDVSVVEIALKGNYRKDTNYIINEVRKSDLTISVNVANGIDKSLAEIRIFQTKKSFPLGTRVHAGRYVSESQQKYRNFIHQHFNWAELENALSWDQLEWNEGELIYDTALKALDVLKNNGLKLRGHNMVWSMEQFVPQWVKTKEGDDLRAVVRKHIEEVLNFTHGLLEHWDVNNENLHGQWFQIALDDRDYDLELFRIMHNVDPYPKLFLNDYEVVASGAATTAYVDQAQRLQNHNLSLYGLGAEASFGQGVEPSPLLIKQRLDTLATVGLPIWITRLGVSHPDENVRADYYEKALRAVFGHPAVEGIVLGGFWGDIQSSGQDGALVTGPNLELTAAGRRVLDLFENQWMTDETYSLFQLRDEFTANVFHGDYEVRVIYKGQELSDLTKTVTVGKEPAYIDIDLHV